MWETLSASLGLCQIKKQTTKQNSGDIEFAPVANVYIELCTLHILYFVFESPWNIYKYLGSKQNFKIAINSKIISMGGKTIN